MKFYKYLNEKELWKGIVDWIIKKAMSMSENEFQTWFLFNSGLEDKGLFSDSGEYGKAGSYLRQRIDGPFSPTGIWEYAQGLEKKLFNINNINIQGTTGKISKSIKNDELKILKSLAKFTNKKYPNIELNVEIGKQWMGVAGDKGFRIPIPNYDDPVNVMFPYDDSVINIYKKYEDKGYSRKKIWAGHMWFHELGHILNIGSEEKNDRFAAKLTSEWLEKTGKK